MTAELGSHRAAPSFEDGAPTAADQHPGSEECLRRRAACGDEPGPRKIIYSESDMHLDASPVQMNKVFQPNDRQASVRNGRDERGGPRVNRTHHAIVDQAWLRARTKKPIVTNPAVIME
ncbi:hypothetical protein GCM10012284_03650 [Mangrovihabitans endophyticus]|uniref:Uncharacterized protein n=1 Tax=Mangrovihabitans endophyticus TaxID=1751298 RepID=A0A8J3FLJ8_9ACTN|nr:hypothetical protein GCM10012284_03650 [Mangrovihabitans endophyticus]